MAVISSIFNFSILKTLADLPRSTKIYLASLTIASAFVVAVCFQILGLIFYPKAWNFENAQILCMGTSHVKYGILPGNFSVPAGKLSLPGLSQALATAAWKAHNTRWLRLKVLLIEVDPFTMLTDPARYTSRHSELCYELDISIWEMPSQQSVRYGWSSKLLTLLQGNGTAALNKNHRLTLQNLLKDFIPAEQPSTLHYKPTLEMAKRRVEGIRQSRVPWAAQNEDGLVEAVRLAQQLGIEAVLISVPVHKIFLDTQPAEWNDVIEQAIERVRRETGEAVPFWDYSGDPRFIDQDFYNIDHLNDSGAAKFTQLLDERLVQSGLIEKPSRLPDDPPQRLDKLPKNNQL